MFIKIRFLVLKRKSHFFWIVFLLVSCKTTSKSEFFGDLRCTIPCWQNITPGITSENSALNIINSSNFIDHESFNQYQYDNPAIRQYSFHINQKSIGSIGSIYTNQEVVYQVNINPDIDIKLVDLVNRFGEPSYIYIEDLSADLICYDINLYYPKHGFMARILYCRDRESDRSLSLDEVRLTSESSVESLLYFEPADSLQSALLNLWQHLDEQWVNYYLSNLVEWEGYGIYTVTGNLSDFISGSI